VGENELVATAAQVRVFINYRHEDTKAEALLLYERLEARFGTDNVFLDLKSLPAGVKWEEEIRASSTGGVLLALMGDRWLSSMEARQQARVVDGTQDYVRLEIEQALKHRSRVIPVLIGNAVPPPMDALPPSLQLLMRLQMQHVDLEHIDADATTLADRIEVIARDSTPGDTASATAAPDAPSTPPDPEPPPAGPTPAASQVARPDTGPATATDEPPPAAAESTGRPTSTPNPVAPRPDSAHVAEILQSMVDEGRLVPVLGPRMESHRRAESLIDAAGSLPGAAELAAGLAKRFKIDPGDLDLAHVAQYVQVTRGWPDLYETLEEMLTADREPSAVHRFFAKFPEMARKLGHEDRYQMIVTTNFDTALEQAFDAEGEWYDLAVYMATGDDKGHFVHFPYDGDPEPVSQPNQYGALPIDDRQKLTRTLIVKIHGAVDGHRGEYGWNENYVVTEDHYIDYLSIKPITAVVPTQILAKLTRSHCLFLGYTMRDWNLRVFLKRIWGGERLGAKSWAVEPDPDMFERELWSGLNVDLYAGSLRDYATRLTDELNARSPAGTSV
jgi:hypothetical protein